MKFIKAPLMMLILTIFALPLFAQDDVITIDNASQLVELGRLGRGTVTNATFAPDSSILAVGGSVGVWLYDPLSLDTLEAPPVLVTPREVNQVSFSTDGSVFVAATDDDLFIADAGSGETLLTVDISGADTAALSPDNSVLAYANKGSVTLLDAATGEEIIVVEKAHSKSITRLVFSPDGSLMASAGQDNVINLWNTADVSLLASLQGHSNKVLDIVFSPDGSMLASASSDKSARLWDVASGSVLTTILHDGEVNAVAFNHDGSVLATGDSKRLIHALAVESAAEMMSVNSTNDFLLTIEAADTVQSLSFSSDSSVLASTSKNIHVQVWDAASGEMLSSANGHTNGMVALSFSPDSSKLIFGGNLNGVWVWDTASNPQISSSRIMDGLQNWSTNATVLAYAPDGSYVVAFTRSNVQVWDETMSEMKMKLETSGQPMSIGISPDSTLISVVAGGGVFVYDAATGEILATLDQSHGGSTIAFSPDQTLLAATSNDGTVHVYGLPH